MISLLQGECDKLIEAAEDDDIEVIKALALSGVDMNAYVNPPVSKCCNDGVTM